jgi:hypothetical protein
VLDGFFENNCPSKEGSEGRTESLRQSPMRLEVEVVRLEPHSVTPSDQTRFMSAFSSSYDLSKHIETKSSQSAPRFHPVGHSPSR